MWEWVSTKPGMMVFPVTSTTRASAGAEPRGPTLTIRLFRITTSALSTISFPFMVMARPPRSTTVPCGRSRLIGTRIRCSTGRYWLRQRVVESTSARRRLSSTARPRATS